MNLDTFTRAYMVAALWSSVGEAGEPLDDAHDVGDLAPETAARMRADCAAFIAANAADLALYAERCESNEQWSAEDLAGHDFWLTRHGHGAGFWDRGLGDLGARLSEAARLYPQTDLYVGDDGKVHA